MDLIKKCFEENCSAFSERLESAGFSSDQTVRFLPEAASRILDSTNRSGVFQTISHLLSGREYEVTKTIDIDAIAEKSGINFEQVTTGLYAIAPVLLQMYSHKTGNINSNSHFTGF